VQHRARQSSEIVTATTIVTEIVTETTIVTTVTMIETVTACTATGTTAIATAIENRIVAAFATLFQGRTHRPALWVLTFKTRRRASLPPIHSIVTMQVVSLQVVSLTEAATRR
jgi:hypothetical protein